MGIRLNMAKASSAILTWGLRNIARRPAGNTPGLVGLKIDPALIRELRSRITQGSIVVVGTNGKTTVTNLLADVMETAGRSVVCNRTGANLNSGIATALLHTKGAQWGVLECDELWSAKVVPDLQPTYFLLLNLFRDQLDRCGEIDRIQDSIVSALVGSPRTRLIYNADDPLCEMVAERAASDPAREFSPKSVAFGVAESMNLEQNVVADATMCQRCLHMFTYTYRQYGQLGEYHCPHCGFTRPPLDFAARAIAFTPEGISFEVNGEPIKAHLTGSYMAYNLTAVFAAATIAGCTPDAIQQAILSFEPKNGRLQKYMIEGHPTLLNLAKNPTGFNQNLRIVESDTCPKAVAFFINDKDVDGHDISWIWDIDFEELLREPNILVYAGGSRRNDVQVRLKYAGVNAKLVDSIDDVFADLRTHELLPADASVYAIANYTALPPVHNKLDEMAKRERTHAEAPTPASTASEAASRTHATISPAAETPAATELAADARGTNAPESAGASARVDAPASSIPAATAPANDRTSAEEPVVIAHILPDLLNLYGDGGNVRVLAQRLRWRNIPVEVRAVTYGDSLDLDDVDLVVLGGSPDREQRKASDVLMQMRDELARYVEDDAPLLAICGSYQMLGRTWLLDNEEVPGLSILGIETRRPGTSADRLVDNIALDSPLSKHPVIGYENHAGRTYLDAGIVPFGKVVSKTGQGNNDVGTQTGLEGGHAADGVLYKGVIGTYLHGPLLSKNPDIADWLLEKALDRHAQRTADASASGTSPATSAEQTDARASTLPSTTPSTDHPGIHAVLASLDDAEELNANAYMARKLL